jgi:signal transduction histidine kinase
MRPRQVDAYRRSMRRARAEMLDQVTAWVRARPWLGDLTAAAVLAGLLAPLSVRLLLAGDLGIGWTIVVCGALVVLHAGVALRRLAPVLVFAALAGAELLLTAAPLLHEPGAGTSYTAVLLPSSLVYVVAAYSVSAHARRPWPLLSLLVGVCGALLVTARVTTGPGQVNTIGEVLFFFAALVAMVAAAWALGRFRRLHAEQLTALAERAERAEADREQRDRQAAADERARIARELHDVVAHSVSVMVRQAEGGRYVAGKDPAAAAAALATIAETGREALTDMRALLGVLDPGPAPHTTEPQPSVDDLAELVERVRASGQPVRLLVEGEPQPLERAAHLAAYRLVQEALTNVVKHAGPDVEAVVGLSWSREALRVRVTDQGLPPPARVSAVPGRGLLGMQERLQLAGGHLRAGPAESGGFEVQGEIPTAAAGAGRRRERSWAAQSG